MSTSSYCTRYVLEAQGQRLGLDASASHLSMPSDLIMMLLMLRDLIDLQ